MKANRCIEPGHGLAAFAVLKGLELIDSAGPLVAAVIDGVMRPDLRIHAAVEAVVSDRLRE